MQWQWRWAIGIFAVLGCCPRQIGTEVWRGAWQTCCFGVVCTVRVVPYVSLRGWAGPISPVLSLNPMLQFHPFSHNNSTKSTDRSQTASFFELVAPNKVDLRLAIKLGRSTCCFAEPFRLQTYPLGHGLTAENGCTSFRQVIKSGIISSGSFQFPLGMVCCGTASSMLALCPPLR